MEANHHSPLNVCVSTHKQPPSLLQGHLPMNLAVIVYASYLTFNETF